MKIPNNSEAKIRFDSIGISNYNFNEHDLEFSLKYAN